MEHRITVFPGKQNISVPHGSCLLTALRSAGLAPDAPCSGQGKCGKCRVTADGAEVLACKTIVTADMTVVLPDTASGFVRGAGIGGDAPCVLAFDIGTTTVAGYLLREDTKDILASSGRRNPQAAYGADVISRVRCALAGEMDALTDSIRQCVRKMALSLCRHGGISSGSVRRICVVGNPAMQQLFLGILPHNLAHPPFAPVITQGKTEAAADLFPEFPQALLVTVPDISGFVGADTLACILSSEMDRSEEPCLLVDIGTNGELVLAANGRIAACSTAAGPALEGAMIRFGMRADPGAIDHVRLQEKGFDCSVVGGAPAVGICGSGLIDAAAAALDAGLLNERGRILNPERLLHLTPEVFLTQEDIRQLQAAKGAIRAGITLLARHLEVSPEQIRQVYLAGAFGSFLTVSSACRIGLLPSCLEDRVTVLGNAAGKGAQLLARDPGQLTLAQLLVSKIEPVELAAQPDFQRIFSREMRFTGNTEYWLQKALQAGFTEAAPLDPGTLIPREDVRAMCAEDRCHAYGKNWTCPPHCGTLEQCAGKIAGYHCGLLLQTVGHTQKAIDTKCYRQTEQQHLASFLAFSRLLRKRIPGALCLGSGGCRICGKCAFPESCRSPEEAYSSMEGYGLFVTQVCRDNGLAYHHGDGTITYTACVLF